MGVNAERASRSVLSVGASSQKRRDELRDTFSANVAVKRLLGSHRT